MHRLLLGGRVVGQHSEAGGFTSVATIDASVSVCAPSSGSTSRPARRPLSSSYETSSPLPNSSSATRPATSPVTSGSSRASLTSSGSPAICSATVVP
jgi:hypothetical protein